MPKAFTPEGVLIPEKDLASHIAKGTARWEEGTVLTFKHGGERYDVPAEEAYKYLADPKWRLESEQETNLLDAEATATTGDAIKAFAGSALDAAVTPFIGSPLARAASESSQIRDELNQERAIHGDATALGEVVGTIAPFGLGLLGRGGAVVGEFAGSSLGVGRNLASRVAPKISSPIARAGITAGIEGGIEGATFAAQREIVNSALGNEEITVSKLLSAGGEGLLYGAAGGAAIGGGLAGIGKAGRALTNKYGLSLSERQAIRSIGATSDDVAKLGEEQVRNIAKTLHERGLLRGGTSKRAYRAGEVLEQVGKEIGEVYRAADEAGAVFNRTNFEKRLAEVTGKLRQGLGDNVKAAQRLEELVGAKLRRTNSFRDAHELVAEVRKRAKDETYGKVKQQAAADLEAAWRTDLYEQVRGASPPHYDALSSLNSAYAALVPAETILRRSSLQDAGRGIGAFEGGVAGLALGAGEPLTGMLVLTGRLATRSKPLAGELAEIGFQLKKAVDGQSLKLSSALTEGAKEGARSVIRTGPYKIGKTVNDYYKRSQAVRDLEADQDKIYQRVEENLGTLAITNPELSAKAAIRIAEDLAYLKELLPVPGLTNKEALAKMAMEGSGKRVETPFDIEVQTKGVPGSAMSKFNRQAKALADPVGEMSKIKEGKMSPETPKVLADRRADLQEYARGELSTQYSNLAASGQTPSYTFRVQSSLLAGQAFDPTMQPEAIYTWQSVWENKRLKRLEEQQNNQPKGKAVSKRLRDRTDQLLTPAQEIMDISE